MADPTDGSGLQAKRELNLLTSILRAQGRIPFDDGRESVQDPAAIPSTQASPVTVNVVSPQGPGQVPQVTTPSPPPPISDELVGSPAYAGGRLPEAARLAELRAARDMADATGQAPQPDPRLAPLLRAQGRDTVTPSGPVVSPSQVPTGPIISTPPQSPAGNAGVPQPATAAAAGPGPIPQTAVQQTVVPQTVPVSPDSSETPLAIGPSGDQPQATEITSEEPVASGSEPEEIHPISDPNGIEARTQSYIAANVPSTPNGFADRMGVVDAQGRALPPTEEDLAYRQAIQLDDSYRNSIGAMARQRAVEEVRQGQELPARRDYDSASARVAQQRIDSLDEFVRLHRQHWDQAKAAQQQADALYPNPDDLLGGRGTWGRALATAIAAIGGDIGLSGTAALINGQLQSQMAGQKASYDRARQRVVDEQGNAAQALASMKEIDAARIGQLSAAKQRLADQFELIAASTEDQAIAAKYQALAAKLQQESAKDLGAFATQTANRDIKNAQLMLSAAQLEERRRQFDIRKGVGGTGVAIGSGAIEALPKDTRKRAVPKMGGGYYLVADDKDAGELRKKATGAIGTVGHIDAVLNILDRFPGLADQLLSKGGVDSKEMLTLRNELTQATMTGKDFYQLGALAAADMGVIGDLGASAEALKKISMTPVKLRVMLENWRRGIARDQEIVQKTYQTSEVSPGSMGEPPQDPKAKSIREHFAPIVTPPTITKAGAPTAMTAPEMQSAVKLGIEAIRRDNPKGAEAELKRYASELWKAKLTTETRLNEMRKAATALKAQGRTTGKERQAAIDSVQRAVDAQEIGVAILAANGASVMRRNYAEKRKASIESEAARKVMDEQTRWYGNGKGGPVRAPTPIAPPWSGKDGPTAGDIVIPPVLGPSAPPKGLRQQVIEDKAKASPKAKGN